MRRSRTPVSHPQHSKNNNGKKMPLSVKALQEERREHGGSQTERHKNLMPQMNLPVKGLLSHKLPNGSSLKPSTRRSATLFCASHSFSSASCAGDPVSGAAGTALCLWRWGDHTSSRCRFSFSAPAAGCCGRRDRPGAWRTIDVCQMVFRTERTYLQPLAPEPMQGKPRYQVDLNALDPKRRPE